MLRRTAARAFAARREREAGGIDPGLPADRVQAMRRFFEALRLALAGALRRTGSRMERETPLLTEDGSRPAGGAEVIGEVRSLVEGVEFELTTRAGRFRFRDSLDGLVHVYACAREGWREVEILGVQKDDSGYRLFVRRADAHRAGFQFTSVRALAEAYVPTRAGG